MKTPALAPRLLAQLTLAMLEHCSCLNTRALVEAQGREAGLTGAEIDAAWTGRSFDVKASSAIAYARAIGSFSPVAIGFSRLRAGKVGLTDQELDLIETEALRLAMLDISLQARPSPHPHPHLTTH